MGVCVPDAEQVLLTCHLAQSLSRLSPCMVTKAEATLGSRAGFETDRSV